MSDFSGAENCGKTMHTSTMDRDFRVQIKSNQTKENKSSFICYRQ
jgi:hypothetical protein